MSGKDSKEPRKIKEFEWYEVETKVREIMSELLQPFNKKQTEDTIKINQIKRNQTLMFKKLQDHDFLLERQNPQKPTYIQLQDDKIAAIENQAQQIQLETHASLKKMEGVIAVYQQKIKQLNQLEGRVDKEIADRVQQFSKFKEGIDKEMGMIFKRQDTQIQEVNTFKNNTKMTITKMETKMISFDNRLKEIEDDNRHRNNELKKVIQDVLSHNEKLLKFDFRINNLTERVEDRQKDSKLSEKFLTKVRQIQGDMKYQNSFLEQYQPLYIQMMISDTLDSFLEGKQRRKLCVFEEQKFARLHRHILDNQRRSIQEMMGTYSNNIRKIVNRNKKFMIGLAVAETIRVGGNIYEFRVQDLVDIEDRQDKKIDVAPTLDPHFITQIVDEKLTNLNSEMISLVKQELKPTRTWMNELQQQLVLRAVDYDKKYGDLKKLLQDFNNKNDLEEKHVSKELNKLGQKLQQLQGSNHFQKEFIKDILNFSSVINHIVIQDEIDRQGTALYALRSNQQDPPSNPTYQLDPSCMTCQPKASNSVQQAFKMACLTYNPSQIKIDEQVFSREEILQISTSVLQKLKKKLWTPQNSKQIIPKKVNDRLFNIKGDTKRKSVSTLKESMRMTGKDREMQTLLPTLGSGRPERRKNQLSVFY